MKTRCWCRFFFSSRRRHTRFDCDWSSDVCSSDLRRRPRTRGKLARASRSHRPPSQRRSEEHTSELQSQSNLVCRLLLEKKKKIQKRHHNAPKNTCLTVNDTPYIPPANTQSTRAAV